MWQRHSCCRCKSCQKTLWDPSHPHEKAEASLPVSPWIRPTNDLHLLKLGETHCWVINRNNFTLTELGLNHLKPCFELLFVVFILQPTPLRGHRWRRSKRKGNRWAESMQELNILPFTRMIRKHDRGVNSHKKGTAQQCALDGENRLFGIQERASHAPVGRINLWKLPISLPPGIWCMSIRPSPGS